jgi:hypothetical protein
MSFVVAAMFQQIPWHFLAVQSVAYISSQKNYFRFFLSSLARELWKRNSRSSCLCIRLCTCAAKKVLSAACSSERARPGCNARTKTQHTNVQKHAEVKLCLKRASEYVTLKHHILLHARYGCTILFELLNWCSGTHLRYTLQNRSTLQWFRLLDSLSSFSFHHC